MKPVDVWEVAISSNEAQPHRLVRLLYRIYCCPEGADWLAFTFTLTLLLGVLAIGGNQLLLAHKELGLMDFVYGGELAEPITPCGATEQTINRADVVRSCWTLQQKHLVPRLLMLDSVWGLFYTIFLVLLYLRLSATPRWCATVAGASAPTSSVRSPPILRSIQKQTELVKSFFRMPDTNYILAALA